jgi:organic hydroperoxide reductase OsmC/OhrA
MLGTLNGALEAREVDLAPDDLVAEVEGINRMRGKVPVLEEIRVHYRIRVPAGDRATLEKVLSRHQEFCPSAQSLDGAVEVSWTADIEEV